MISLRSEKKKKKLLIKNLRLGWNYSYGKRSPKGLNVAAKVGFCPSILFCDKWCNSLQPHQRGYWINKMMENAKSIKLKRDAKKDQVVKDDMQIWHLQQDKIADWLWTYPHIFIAETTRSKWNLILLVIVIEDAYDLMRYDHLLYPLNRDGMCIS